MTGFAYSGLGLNPHFGAPTSLGPQAGHSGALHRCSRCDGRHGGGRDWLGRQRFRTDSFSLCGLAGFKPTQSRVPIEGAFASRRLSIP